MCVCVCNCVCTGVGGWVGGGGGGGGGVSERISHMFRGVMAIVSNAYTILLCPAATTAAVDIANSPKHLL